MYYAMLPNLIGPQHSVGWKSRYLIPKVVLEENDTTLSQC